jgi:hypothetical protein
MSREISKTEIENLIRAKLAELIRLAAQHGIGIEPLIYEALDLCDPEPPLSR